MATSNKLLILLARFTDSENSETQPVSFYEDLLINRGTGGLNDYWIDASLGAINLDGSVIHGWFTIDKTRDEFAALYPKRYEKIRATITASGQSTDGFATVVCLFNIEPNDGGAAGGVIAGPAGTNLTFLAHETGHMFGLNHSFDESRRKLSDWSQPGEYYDPFDIMSAMNVASDAGHRFSPRGPLLNTPNIRRMGWMPDHRIWRPSSIDTGQVFEVDIVALESPEVNGYLMADVAFLTAEFRIPGGWDSGIAEPTVLIHAPGETHSIIMASNRPNYVVTWKPGQTCKAVDHFSNTARGPEISVVRFDVERRIATLRIINRALTPKLPDLIIPDYTLEGGILAGDGTLLVKVGNRFFRIPIPQPEIVTEGDQVTAVRFGAREFGRADVLLESELTSEVGTLSVHAINGKVEGI